MKRLLYYSGLYAGSAALLKLAGVVLFLWLGRSLEVDEYGRFGLFYALQQGLAAFAMAGIVEAVVGRLKEHQSQALRAQLFSAARGAFLLMALAAGGISLLVWVLFFRGSDMRLPTWICAVGAGVCLALSTLLAQLVRLEEKHGSSLLLSTVTPLSALLGSFVGFALARTVHSFFLGSVVGALVCLLGWRIGRIGAWDIGIPFDQTRRILWRAVPFVLVTVLGWLGGYGNNYVIAVFFPRAEIARFTFALSIASVMLLIATALNQVWSPRFYRLIHEEPFEQVERKNQGFSRLLAMALGCVGGIVVLLFPVAIRILGGNLVAYQNMRLELSLLLAGYVLSAPRWQCDNHFLSNAMGQSVLWVALVTGVVGIASLLILMVWLGPIGVYLGFLLQFGLRSMGSVVVARRHWPIRVGWDGIAVGLSMILVGFVLSAPGIPAVTTLASYSIIVVALVGMFFRTEVNRLVAR